MFGEGRKSRSVRPTAQNMKSIGRILSGLFILVGFIATSNLLHAQEYQNGINRDIIQFSIEMTNNYLNKKSAPISLNITKGLPDYYAVLINDTNLAAAVWKPYTSSNLTVTLGSKDGTYNVSVGLRGQSANMQQTWQSKTIFKDAVPLQLVITNLTSLSGSRPFIDPAGYATKAIGQEFLRWFFQARLMRLSSIDRSLFPSPLQNGARWDQSNEYNISLLFLTLLLP